MTSKKSRPLIYFPSTGTFDPCPADAGISSVKALRPLEKKHFRCHIYYSKYTV